MRIMIFAWSRKEYNDYFRFCYVVYDKSFNGNGQQSRNGL